MNVDLVKQKLRDATTAIERQDAIASAIELGMPLGEIERYLDWVDAAQQRPNEPEKNLSEKKTESLEGDIEN